MDHPDDNLDLPPELKQALRGLYAPSRPFAGDDEQIRSAAHAARGVRAAGRWRWVAGVGLAAAVALAGTLWCVEYTTGARPHAAAAAYARTGDIRDAFYVARQLRAHQPLDATWDTNGDGVVDEKDWHALAAAAVSLSPRGTVQ